MVSDAQSLYLVTLTPRIELCGPPAEHSADQEFHRRLAPRGRRGGTERKTWPECPKVLRSRLGYTYVYIYMYTHIEREREREKERERERERERAQSHDLENPLRPVYILHKYMVPLESGF